MNLVEDVEIVFGVLGSLGNFDLENYTSQKETCLPTMDVQGLLLATFSCREIVKHSQLQNRLSEEIADAPCMEYTSLHLP